MDPARFDDVAKSLATTGASRRRLVRTLGGGLAGAMLAAVGVRAAGAQRPDRPDRPERPERPPRGDEGGICADWCAQQFADARDASLCLRDAGRGRGPCYESGGPMGPCPDGLTRQNGYCVDLNVSCPMGRPLCGGSSQLCYLPNNAVAKCATSFGGATPACVLSQPDPGTPCTKDEDCQGEFNGVSAICVDSTSCGPSLPKPGVCIYGVRVATAP